MVLTSSLVTLTWTLLIAAAGSEARCPSASSMVLVPAGEAIAPNASWPSRSLARRCDRRVGSTPRCHVTALPPRESDGTGTPALHGWAARAPGSVVMTHEHEPTTREPLRFQIERVRDLAAPAVSLGEYFQVCRVPLEERESVVT
jgi:hypothetical protein